MRSVDDRTKALRRYRKALQKVDLRIAVSGTRGKSTTVRWHHDVFHSRGYDTFAKITGDVPVTLQNGVEESIERHGAQVSLYENRDVVSQATERLVEGSLVRTEVAIFENHAISEYTMRTFNETFFEPDVVVVPNIRSDHLETLGRTRQNMTRSFARSIPSGTHVVSGERNDALHEYFADELSARDASVGRVDVPDEYADLPGVENVFAVNAVLDIADEPPVPEERLVERLMEMQPRWWRLENGQRMFNAAKVNDVESTELVRKQLVGSNADAELVCPFVFLRDDRRGRTASFREYIDNLYDRHHIDRVHVGGANARVFAKRVKPDVTVHDIGTESPADVLDSVLEEGQPTMTMANTVHPFMREFVAEMEDRTVETVESHALQQLQ